MTSKWLDADALLELTDEVDLLDPKVPPVSLAVQTEIITLRKLS